MTREYALSNAEELPDEPTLAELISSSGMRLKDISDIAAMFGLKVKPGTLSWLKANEHLKEMPDGDTIEGIAAGLGLSDEYVLLAAWRSTGRPRVWRPEDLATVIVEGDLPPKVLERYQAAIRRAARNAVK